jgi:hypothetical protein
LWLQVKPCLPEQGVDLASNELEAFSYLIAHDPRATRSSIDGFGKMLLQAAGNGRGRVPRALAASCVADIEIARPWRFGASRGCCRR